jgi:hypothetical protein
MKIQRLLIALTVVNFVLLLFLFGADRGTLPGIPISPPID